MNIEHTARASGLAPFSHRDTHIDSACLLNPVFKMLEISKRAESDDKVSIDDKQISKLESFHTVQCLLCF